MVSVDASSSSDVDGDTLSYTWDFDGSIASGVNATHTYLTGGVKTITLTVADGKGMSDTTTIMTASLVKPNSAPTPAFEFTTSALEASFDASMSIDEESDTLTYAWDFGDSQTSPSSSQATATHTYSAANTYIVTLTVSDATGSTTLEKLVTVSLDVNTDPVANFTPTANNLMVTLYSESTDADGDELTYKWIIDSTVVSTSNLDSYTFATSGVKTIELEVTDSRGATDSIIQTITLANQAPTASFSISTAEGVATFDGSGSTDPENDTLSYAWDFGDSMVGTDVAQMHTYSESGTYTVKLTVNDGVNSAFVERDVTVELAQNSAPRASFTITQDASNEYLYTLDASTSSDSDGDSLTYAWSFDNTSSTDMIVSHTFAADASYEITLTVTDGELSDSRISYISTVEVLDGNLGNGEVLYDQQCAQCHEGDDETMYGEGNTNYEPIAINRYLDHQANLFEKIETTTPTTNPALCVGQCAADIEAFMRTWERIHTEVMCLPSDESEINYGPRQMRLLTSAEYVNTVKTLFDYDVDTSLLPSDDQIHFFSKHAKTSLNSSRLDAFESIAKKIVEFSSAQNFANVVGVDVGFTDGVARRAFRRPLDSVETAGYVSLEETGYGDALQALLISPYFLFRSELGMTKAEFIDFNENADPVYKPVGAATLITPEQLGLTGGVLEIYSSKQFNHTFNGGEKVQLSLIGSSSPGYGDAGESDSWPLVKLGVQNGSVLFEGRVPPKTTSLLISTDLVGSQTLYIENGQQNHPQNGSRIVTVNSISISEFEQVIFEVPEIEEGSYALTPYEMATFIAYTYTGNTPDDILLEAANSGLATEAAIRTQIERLMATDAAKVHFGTFVDQWLMTDGVLTAAKDETLFPEFTQSVRESMAQEAREIFNDVIFNETGFTSLFDSNNTFVNDVLADFYGTGGATGTDFVKVSDEYRGGLLTTGAFLASQATPEESHLIKRAVRIRERVMCQHLPPFPTDVDLDTIREIQAQKVEDKKAENDGEIRQAHLDFINTDVEACKGCHEYIINPLGVALEDYDAVGLPRTHYLKEDGTQGLSIDFTGFDSSLLTHNASLYGVDDLYETTDRIALSGTKSVGQVMAGEEVTRECLQEMAFRFIMDTGPDQYDHAVEDKIVLAEDELVNYACAMDSMNDAMSVGDNPREAFINLGLSEIVRFRKEYNR